MKKIKEVAKMIAALAGALVTLGSSLIPVEWNEWIGLAAVIATAIATYSIPNAQPEETVDEYEFPEPSTDVG